MMEKWLDILEKFIRKLLISMESVSAHMLQFMDMPEIIPYATFDRKYTGIAKYPAVTRDISMVVPKEILVGQIEDVIEKKRAALI